MWEVNKVSSIQFQALESNLRLSLLLFTPPSSISNTGKSHLEKGVINVGEEPSALVKYTFSDAISTSVKLGIWELSLMKIIDSIEPISEDLKERRGVQIKENEALQKTGEILALRHLVNLSRWAQVCHFSTVRYTCRQWIMQHIQESVVIIKFSHSVTC